MDTSRLTSRLTDTSAITDHLPKGGASAIVSNLADATTGFAEQISDHAGQLGSHVGDLDVSGGVRRGRRLLAGVVPWMSPPRRTTSRRWLMIAGAVVAVVATLAVVRRRSSHEQPARDDWTTTPSANGAAPAERSHERQTAGAPA